MLSDIRLPFKNLKICVQQSAESVTLLKKTLDLRKLFLLQHYIHYLHYLYKFILSFFICIVWSIIACKIFWHSMWDLLRSSKAKDTSTKQLFTYSRILGKSLHFSLLHCPNFAQGECRKAYHLQSPLRSMYQDHMQVLGNNKQSCGRCFVTSVTKELKSYTTANGGSSSVEECCSVLGAWYHSKVLPSSKMYMAHLSAYLTRKVS